MSWRKAYRSKKMKSVYESIMTGLQEAVDDAQARTKN